MEILIKNKKRIALITAIAIVVIIGIWIIFTRHSAKDTKNENIASIYVKTSEIAEKEIPDILWASGTIKPIEEAKLAPKIMSTVTDIFVKEGDYVKAGQVLAKLEAKDLASQSSSASAGLSTAKSMSDKANVAIELQYAQTRANIVNAQAALKMAKEQLSLAQEGPRKQEKTQAKLAVIQAEAQYRNAETDLGRMSKLYEQGAVAKQRVDESQTQFDVAKAQLGIAKQQAEMSIEGSRNQDIISAKQRVKQAEAVLRLAKASVVQNKMAQKEAKASASMVDQARAVTISAATQTGYSVIKAPFSGRITGKFINIGDMTMPGSPILSMENNSLYRLEVSVPVQNMSSLHVGDIVYLELNEKQKIESGKVSVISPAGDSSSHKFLVKIDIPNSLNAVSGNFGRAGIKIGSARGIVISESALHDDSGILNVYVAGENNRVDMRIVRTGRKTPDGIEVITGLIPGDNVITWSSSNLYDDASIKIKENR